MLSKIQATVIIVVGALFAGFGVWGFVPPVSEDVVVQLVNLIFIILGSLGVGGAAVAGYNGLKNLVFPSHSVIADERDRKTGFRNITLDDRG